MQARLKSNGQAGQAAVEYLVVAMGVLIALVAITFLGQEQCIAHMSGELSASECRNLGKSVTAALQHSVEEITFLINLPF